MGFLVLVVLLGAILLGVLQLATATFSAWIILWVSLPVVAVPLALLVGYRLYGLLTARYRLDRDGFYLMWGLNSEQVPLASIRRLQAGSDIAPNLRPRLGLWWPGCLVGHREIEGVGQIEFFATTAANGIVVLHLEDRSLAISPPDPEGFHQSFTAAMRMGSLEPIPERSLRPDFTSTRLWNDLPARVLIITGMLIPLFLLGYLAVRAPSMPSQVPFGFDLTGAPNTLAPPGRLLLLPMIGGLCWLVDLVAGVWLYRREQDRILAYVMWTTAALVGGLLWGATLQLLAAA
ncbi:MAG: hypothetical protein GTO14_16935 [Anaerolineales bacterium]|nr:hypothetical protein [Anaerolineales bacterium]